MQSTYFDTLTHPILLSVILRQTNYNCLPIVNIDGKTSIDFHRYLFNRINWDNYVIGLKGARGVGKSTLLLLHIKENFNKYENILYVSLDNLWFSSNSQIDLVDYFTAHNGTHLFLDEIHRYPNWQTFLKNISDDYP